MKIVISSGHGLYVRGASGILDEVDEARKVVPAVAEYLEGMGHQVVTFNDDTSQTQNENLETIVDFHNSQERELDVSVHFNCYEQTSKPMGTEVLYTTQDELAGRVSRAISVAGELIDRGPKERDDLYFLNQTEMPAILLEICFVDSEADVEAYERNFDAICRAIAEVAQVASVPERPDQTIFEGKVSWFGGPDDSGVSPSEGLAFLYEYEDAPHLFLPEQPAGTSGLARRLNPDAPYVACRWDYSETPKSMLADRSNYAVVRSKRSGLKMLAWPADWGPHEDTDRVADVSPGILNALGLETDDEVEVIYPAPRRGEPK